ncbi:uncharacterized protein [Lepeophtheirus salmonis]|nr:uncharacterized protein LOC121128654 [Lepeophtheirus salmonis]
MYFLILFILHETLALVPDIFTYSTCINSPPEFSPGCMANLTVNLGDSAVFNCQVDPRCHIQYLYWYHEVNGQRRLLKTGKNSSEPYSHTIHSVLKRDLGRYHCVIANIRGKNECSASLSLNSQGNKPHLWTTVGRSHSANHRCLHSMCLYIIFFVFFGRALS